MLINRGVTSTIARPQAYTLWTPRPIQPIVRNTDPPVDYITWTGLVDRQYTGRHLPPAPQSYMDRLPPLANDSKHPVQPPPKTVLDLYKRDHFIPSANCSALLCFFAQWFTDSFLRKHPVDERLNTSNHEIDLCQIYGLDAETARRLRTLQNGKLRTSADGRFPDRLYGSDNRVNPHYENMPYIRYHINKQSLEEIVLGSLTGGEQDTSKKLVDPREIAHRRAHLYATGLERGNSTILYTAISTIFIREHNRLCELLHAAHPTWDDDRLFEIARNINIVMVLNLTINEYINQLAQPPIKLFLDRTFAEKEHWYRANRIAIEFGLLYRWHSFVPDGLQIANKRLNHLEYRFNNALLESYGAATVIAAASREPAGRVGMHNNPEYLWQAEYAAHQFARNQRVRPYNEYRVFFGQKPIKDFKELTGDDQLANELAQLYRDVDDVEFLVGLFAQKRSGPAVLPGLLNAMVAVDAFSQILTNPLLSQNVYGPDAFSELGMKIIDKTTSFDMLVERNRMGEDYPNPASFAYPPAKAQRAAA
jgi:prostaglandin-endoperoxide synthase 2